MQVMILSYAQLKYHIDFRENIRTGKPLYSLPDKEMLFLGVITLLLLVVIKEV